MGPPIVHSILGEVVLGGVCLLAQCMNVAARVGAVCLLACVIACGLCEVPGGLSSGSLLCAGGVRYQEENRQNTTNTFPFIQGPAHRTPRNLLRNHSAIHPFKILRQNGTQIYIRQLRKMTKLDGLASSPLMKKVGDGAKMN